MGLVLRLLTKYVRPFGSDDRKGLLLGAESFLDLPTTDWSGGTGICQNRALVGTGWQLSDKPSIETGYLSRLPWVDNGWVDNEKDVSNHLAVLNFRTKF
jgi:hypothetical protein